MTKIVIENIKQFEEDYQILSVKEIKLKYNLPYTMALYNVLKKYNIKQLYKRDLANKKYTINDNYFNVIDTPEKAYILGLIYTDGNLPVKSNHTIIISNTDKDLLDLIKNEIKYTGKIYREYHKKFKKEIFKLTFSSLQMRKDLELIGLTSNKTFTIKYPNIPKHLNNAFINGLWDGDGNVSITLPSIKNNKKLLSAKFVSANKQFIETMLLNLLELKNKTIYERKRVSILYEISFRAKDSLRLRKYMYENEYSSKVFMERKKKKFYDFNLSRTFNDYNQLS